MKKFQLMALPYEGNALQPVISPETIAFHHGKHLAAYVMDCCPIVALKTAHLRRLYVSQREQSSIMPDKYSIMNCISGNLQQILLKTHLQEHLPKP